MSHAGKAEGIAGTPPLLFTDSSPFDRPDDSSKVILNAGALHGYPGKHLNQATINAPIATIDTLPANNLAQATVTILISTILSITKTNAVFTLAAGQTSSCAICPAGLISLTALQGSGITLNTFPASSNLVLTVICGVTATGQSHVVARQLA